MPPSDPYAADRYQAIIEPVSYRIPAEDLPGAKRSLATRAKDTAFKAGELAAMAAGLVGYLWLESRSDE